MKKQLIAYLFLLCNVIGLQAEDHSNMGLGLFLTSTAILAAAHRKNQQQPIDPAKVMVQNIKTTQNQQISEKVRTDLRNEPKKPLLLLKNEPEWKDEEYKTFQQNVKSLSCSSPVTVTIAILSPNPSDDDLPSSAILSTASDAASENLAVSSASNALSTALFNQVHQELIHKFNGNNQGSRATILQAPTTNSDLEKYSFIANDGENPETLPTNPLFNFRQIALQAQLFDIKKEPSLYEQTNIIAQANFKIRQLAARYDNDLEIATQAQQTSRDSFAINNDRLGEWQYKCDHIKQKGLKRVSVNTQWTTQELHQVWITKQMYQNCTLNPDYNVQTALTEYETLESQRLQLHTYQALIIAIKDEIKPLKSRIDQIFQDYLNQHSNSLAQVQARLQAVHQNNSGKKLAAILRSERYSLYFR